MQSLNVVIIPAYNPDIKLIELLKELKDKTNYHIIVVNDGSSNECASIFKDCKKYGEVIEHLFNEGKGEAIKTALKYINKVYNDTFKIVIADADGQHKVKDIISVCNAIKKRNSLAIGSRKFTGNVPLRSRVGNSVTRHVFKIVSGQKIMDTQTGLRGFNSNMIPFLMSIEGSRYEYEMNVLLACSKSKLEIIETPIETIYLDENKASHFHPIRDSISIYKNILKFSLSSMASFFMDYSIYSLLIYLTKILDSAASLLISNIIARIISSTLNYYINRKYVFNNNDKVTKTAVKYFVLATCILFVNTVILTFLVEGLGISKLISKVLVEIILFFISWVVQRLVIFNNKEGISISYENK